jgi:cell division transport system ATP-binding protein
LSDGGSWSALRGSRAASKSPVFDPRSPIRDPIVISFSQVCKRYPGGHEALRGVGFTVEGGEMVFLAGHSGAGKSTLFKLIAAIERPTSGTVIVNAQNVGAMRARAVPFLRRNLGLVFQDQKLLFDRSVLDNVLLPLQVTGFDRKEAGKRARAALDKVGLLGRERSRPVTLSGGEQQRLCIARAIVNRPSILLADEPTANLDAAYAGEIMDIFRSFNQVGVTVLVATHDQAMIDRFSARVLRLDHGALAA